MELDQRKDLQWWLQQLKAAHGHPIVPTYPQIVLASDASKTQWGASCLPQRTGGRWTPVESSLHINELELTAAWFALKSFEGLVSGKHVLIQMDNRTAVTYLNKMVGTHAKDLLDLAMQIWQWSLERNIVITAEYLPRKENVIADQKSCHHRDASNWKLDTQIFSYLALRWGPFWVDLFSA